MRRVAQSTGLAAIAAALFAAALVPDAFAVDRVHFKNGHVIEVREIRTEGKMAFLKLPDGSQMGIPAALIDKVEGNAEPLAQRGTVTQNVRGPSLTQLHGYRQFAQPAGPGQIAASGPLRMSKGGEPGPKLSIGFVSEGSVDVTAVPVQRQDAQSVKQSAFAPQRVAALPWNDTTAPAKPDGNSVRAEFAVAEGSQNQ